MLHSFGGPTIFHAFSRVHLERGCREWCREWCGKWCGERCGMWRGERCREGGGDEFAGLAGLVLVSRILHPILRRLSACSRHSVASTASLSAARSRVLILTDVCVVCKCRDSRALSEIHGHFPRFTGTLRDSRTLSEIHGHFPRFTGTFRDARTLSEIHGHFPRFTDTFRDSRALSEIHAQPSEGDPPSPANSGKCVENF